MIGSEWILLVLLAAIAVLMGIRMWGRSFDDLLAERDREHHRVMALLARHPEGGSWRDYRRWMEREG